MDDMPIAAPARELTEVDKLKEQVRTYKHELDKLTRMLCDATETFERLVSNGVRMQLLPEHAEWWEKHKAADEKRRAKAERLEKAKQAFAKKAAEIAERKERAEYNRLKEKYGNEPMSKKLDRALKRAKAKK
jgi:hypothetical protein